MYAAHTHRDEPANEAWVAAHEVSDFVLLALQLPDVQLCPIIINGSHGSLCTLELDGYAAITAAVMLVLLHTGGDSAAGRRR